MSIAWLLAEFIGTFTLIFIGAGSVLLDKFTDGGVGILGIAVAHGLAIGVMVAAVMQFSGGKLNPAVSLGIWAGGKNDTKTTIFEIIAQLAGAVVGALFLKFIFPDAVAEATKLGTPAVAEGISISGAIFAEAIFTFLLVFVVWATAVDPRGNKIIAGFAIGMVILFDILVGAGITGAAINPARAFGPALISNTWTDQLVYWIGPIIGGILAGLLYNYVFLKYYPKTVEEVEIREDLRKR